MSSTAGLTAPKAHRRHSTGLRVGEAVALTWADLDLKGKTVSQHLAHSDHQCNRGNTAHEAGVPAAVNAAHEPDHICREGRPVSLQCTAGL